MDWFIAGALGVLVFTSRPVLRLIPPYWLYVSRRKRRAMRLVIRFIEERQLGRLDWSGCRIEKASDAEVFVLVSYITMLSHAQKSVWVVSHEGTRAEHLESSEFRFGRRPEHVISEYETGLTSRST